MQEGDEIMVRRTGGKRVFDYSGSNFYLYAMSLKNASAKSIKGVAKVLGSLISSIASRIVGRIKT
jgi:hypothetical protein